MARVADGGGGRAGGCGGVFGVRHCLVRGWGVV